MSNSSIVGSNTTSTWGSATYSTGQFLSASCSACYQTYNVNSGHYCQGTTLPITWTTTTGTTLQNMGTITFGSNFKNVKEITTDIELIYEWSDSSFNMKLPAKFGDCFLKVGYTWSPLYPLIFSAIENDSKELSFHLVTGITDKSFEGDTVILKSVTSTKIEDNLTLLQLAEKVRNHFKEYDKTNPTL